MIRILEYIQSNLSNQSNIENGLKNIIELCSDDQFHSLDFGRKNGISLLLPFIQEPRENSNSIKLITLALKVFIVTCDHADFCSSFVDFTNTDIQFCNNKLLFALVCNMMNYENEEVSMFAIKLSMRILKNIPYSSSSYKASDQLNGYTELDLFLKESSTRLFCQATLNNLKRKSFDIQSISLDLLTAFLSELVDYFTPNKDIDYRMESVVERKLRLHVQGLLKYRAQYHASCCMNEGILEQLLVLIDDESPLIRQRVGPCFSYLIKSFNNDEIIKQRLQSYIVLGPGDDNQSSSVERIFEPSDYPPIAKCRLRAAIESMLLVINNDLGAWALNQSGGIQQLLLLISTNEERCQLIASEVLCLAAGNDATSGALVSIIPSGVLNNLMSSNSPAIRAAGVSTMSKLMIKSKTLNESSSEIAIILNTAISIINGFESSSSSSTATTETSPTGLVQFSKGNQKAPETSLEFYHKHSTNDKGVLLTSSERAVEVIAAMVGRTHVKEELVHGSYRTAPAMKSLLKLATELDMRSSAAYGIAHIVACITITNRELKAKALADKEMSLEQYEQLQELHRIKAKNEDGSPLEERRDEEDPDTSILCRQRIKKLAQTNVFTVLLRILSEGSVQARDSAACSLAQMMVEESVRGAAIQQGLIKTCSNIIADNETAKTTRQQAAHAVAKALVTTNPNIIPEHSRISCITILLFLCRDVDSSNLQQFESLLSLTNLLSCGNSEHQKFIHLKGVQAVHYLMFSNHMMVRRAASEVFCNIATNEAVLAILRQPDKVRLWLGLSEDWNNENDPNESYLIARATTGTLAMAAVDEDVCRALLQENVASTLVTLLNSGKPELVHRTLVIISSLLDNGGEEMANHLMHGSIVPALSIVTSLKDPSLVDLARDIALSLTKTLSK